jgi:hypothetical protein
MRCAREKLDGACIVQGPDGVLNSTALSATLALGCTLLTFEVQALMFTSTSVTDRPSCPIASLLMHPNSGRQGSSLKGIETSTPIMVTIEKNAVQPAAIRHAVPNINNGLAIPSIH